MIQFNNDNIDDFIKTYEFMRDQGMEFHVTGGVGIVVGPAPEFPQPSDFANPLPSSPNKQVISDTGDILTPVKTEMDKGLWRKTNHDCCDQDGETSIDCNCICHLGGVPLG